MYNWVIAKYRKPNTWTDSQFESITDDVYTTFFEKAEPEKVVPEKQSLKNRSRQKQEMLSLNKVTSMFEVIVIGLSSSELECSSTSELECSSTSESSSSELSSYVSSYDESSSSDESGCLEKSDVNDHDEEEIDEEDEIDEGDDEIHKEADDGKDDDELWSPKSIRTTSKNLISLKMKGASSNSTPSTKKQLVKSNEPIRNCIIGLANNKIWEMIVNKKFGVKKEEVKEQVKESKEQVKKGVVSCNIFCFGTLYKGFRHLRGRGFRFYILPMTSVFQMEDSLGWKLVETFSRIASKWGDLMDVDEDELNYHSKRLCVFTKVRQNIQESFKVNFRGKVHWVRAIEVPGWIPEFNDEEEEDDVSDECNFDGKPEAQEENNIFEESEEEKVQETEFGVPSGEKVNKSEDPFGIYSLLQKNKTNMENKVNEEDHSLSHPPGFTPEVDQFEGNAMGDIAEKVYTEKENDVNSFVNKDIGNNDSNSVNNNVEPTDLDRSKLLRSGGSILNFMEEVVKVGQTMGYNMEGCIKDINDIIESQGEFGVIR
ncbi:hypothetical protein Tco_0579514 [Tanacetum coccineum]